MALNWSDAATLPAGAQSVLIEVFASTSTSTPARLVLNRPTASGTVDAPVGEDIFKATAYALADAKGDVVAKAQTIQTIQAGTTNTVTIEFPDTSRITSVSVSLSKGNLAPGGTSQAVGKALDRDGQTVPGVSFEWRSSNPEVATVNDVGVITAKAVGTATITASEPKSGRAASAQLTVTETVVTISKLEVGPGTGSVPVGATVQLAATAYDGKDEVIEDVTYMYSSSNPTVLNVDASGRAVAKKPGNATLTVTAEGKQASATLNVTPASNAPAAVSWRATLPYQLPSLSDILTTPSGDKYALTIFNDLFMLPAGSVVWRPIYADNLTSCNDLFLDASNKAALFANCSPRTKRSVDAGRTWQFADIAAPTRSTEELGTVTRGLTSTFYYLPIFNFALDLTNSNRLLLLPGNTSGRDAGAFITLDGGETWKSFAAELSQGALAQSNKLTTRWFATAAYGTVYRSGDDAATFATVGRVPYNPEFYTYKLVPSHQNADKLYALSSAGVHRSTDAGATWQWASRGLAHAFGSDLLIHPDNDQTLFVAGGVGVYKSTDGGESWTLHVTGLKNVATNRLALSSDKSTLFVGVYGGGVYRSLDGGITFEWVSRDLENYQVNALATDPTDPDVVYVGTQGGVYKSTDKGSSWVLASQGLYSPFTSWLAVSQDGQTLYVGTQDNGIYRGQPSSTTGAGFPTQ